MNEKVIYDFYFYICYAKLATPPKNMHVWFKKKYSRILFFVNAFLFPQRDIQRKMIHAYAFFMLAVSSSKNPTASKKKQDEHLDNRMDEETKWKKKYIRLTKLVTSTKKWAHDFANKMPMYKFSAHLEWLDKKKYFTQTLLSFQLSRSLKPSSLQIKKKKQISFSSTKWVKKWYKNFTLIICYAKLATPPKNMAYDSKKSIP